MHLIGEYIQYIAGFPLVFKGFYSSIIGIGPERSSSSKP